MTVPLAGPPDEPPVSARLSTYDYDLPQGLIAQEPASRRDRARLLTISRTNGTLGHKTFKDLPSLLDPSDLLVINETRVVPASLTGYKPTGGKVDLLVLDPAGAGEKDPGGGEPAVRVCMARSSKPLRQGTPIVLDGDRELKIVGTTAAGRVRVQFPVSEEGFVSWLGVYGRPPLPPYIKTDENQLDRDRDRYQTVYGRVEGSVAAPTAGLHFTDHILEDLGDRGIELVRVVLHVGPGTFIPVRCRDIRDHSMEKERYEISPGAWAEIQKARAEGRRIVAVGTTSVRTLEAASARKRGGEAINGSTDLFIAPGYSFGLVRGLITNFHLPESTLLMLVCAFGGTDRIMAAYGEAIRLGYRFYSYGDACLIID